LSVEVKVDNERCDMMVAAIRGADLTDDQVQAMQDEWDALIDAGAEPFEIGFCYGVMHIYPSDELRGTLSKYGVT